jgi:hypothetical protein
MCGTVASSALIQQLVKLVGKFSVRILFLSLVFDASSLSLTCGMLAVVVQRRVWL